MTAAMLALVMGTAAGCMSDGKMMKSDDGMMKKEGTMEKK
jgi:hypothetical protein